jgi:polyhydroxyalkanoate synthesis regulator phasin
MYEEKQIQKQRNFSEKYSKDLVATKKKLTELESRYGQLEKQVRSLLS